MKLRFFNSHRLTTSADSSTARRGHTRMAAVAAAVLLTSLISSSFGLAGAGASSTGPASGSSSQLVLTRNGLIVGQVPAPPRANDLHYVWSAEKCRGNNAFPLVKLFWTVNGNVVGDELLAPCYSNDFEFAWNADGTITTASWTQDGKPVEQLTPPPGANDVHLFLTGKTHLIKAWWTYYGKPIKSIRIHGFVNDMHWYGYPIPVATTGAPTYLFFTRDGKIVGQVQAPTNANDLHYVWTTGRCRGAYAYPLVRLYWTLNGKILGSPTLAPCKANDFEFSWNPNGMITSASWTENGLVIANAQVPAGVPVNDAHVYLSGRTRLLAAWWTYNGQPIGKIKIPRIVNDMHWYGYPITKTPALPSVPESIYR